MNATRLRRRWQNGIVVLATAFLSATAHAGSLADFCASKLTSAVFSSSEYSETRARFAALKFSQALKDLKVQGPQLSALGLLAFFDSLAAENSASLHDLGQMSKIESVRYSRLPWSTTVGLRRKKLILPQVNWSSPELARELAKVYLSVAQLLRFKALKTTTSPFRLSVGKYRERALAVLGRSEFQIYDVLAILDPDLLDSRNDQRSGDLSWRDRLRLSGGTLPSFLQPSQERAFSGWMGASCTSPQVADQALRRAIGNDINYFWFGDTESRVKATCWKAVRIATIAGTVLSVLEMGPEIYSFWQSRRVLMDLYQNTSIGAVTDEDIADTRQMIHEHAQKKLAEVRVQLQQDPQSLGLQDDLRFYEKRVRDTAPKGQ